MGIFLREYPKVNLFMIGIFDFYQREGRECSTVYRGDALEQYIVSMNFLSHIARVLYGWHQSIIWMGGCEIKVSFVPDRLFHEVLLNSQRNIYGLKMN